MRGTRVVTVDGNILAVPNSTIVNTTVASYTNFPHLRLDVAATVGVSEDVGAVRALLLEIVRGAEIEVPYETLALAPLQVSHDLRPRMTQHRRPSRSRGIAA